MTEKAFLDHKGEATITSVYDQHIHVVGEGAIFAGMPINPDAVTEFEVFEVYDNLPHTNYGAQGEKTHYYQLKDLQISFHVNDDYVTAVSVDGTHVEE